MGSMKRLMFLAPVLLAGCVIYDRPATVIPARVPLTAGEMIAMLRGGTSDETIRKELSIHGVARKLTADELIQLKEAGAGDELLQAAVAAEVRQPREAQVVYHRNRYDGYHRYSYDPGIFFGLGVAFGHVLGWGHRGYPRRSRACW
jgi:hypothetical protein